MHGGDAVHEALGADKALGFAHDLMRDHPDAQVYLVGGFVRDALLGRVSKDADFVVRGLASEKLESWLRKHGDVVFVGRAFGVYKFRPKAHPQHEEIDIALPRTEKPMAESEGGYRDFDMHTDAMLPIEQDLARRDFTVNAIAYEIKRGVLVDPHEGQKDLEARVLRTVGAPLDRFREDLSRILRAVRFAAVLDLEIENDTWWAVKELTPSINRKRVQDEKDVYVVPRETAGSELAKAISAHPKRALDLLHSSGLLRELLPEMERLIVHAEYLEPLARLEKAPVDAIFAVLLRGIPSEQIRGILRRSGLDTLGRGQRARLDADAIIQIIKTVQNDGRPDPSTLPSVEFERFFMNGRSLAYLAVLEAMGHADEARRARLRAAEIRARWWATDDEKIPALVSGDDAVRLGVDPGPAVRLLLDALRTAQLDGAVKTRPAALHHLEQLIKETA